MIGILLTNTGTPDAPTPKAVRRYLREFLSDKRIVHIPSLVWLPILYGLVLPFRAPKSAKLYQEIWTAEGSPMRVHMESVRAAVQDKLGVGYAVAVGMNYGNPSIPAGMKILQDAKVEKIIVLPLFPQYSDTSAGSTLDRVNDLYPSPARWAPSPTRGEGLFVVKDYHDAPKYISALAESVKTAWQKNKSEHLLISFHGIPERFAAEGDPYPTQCARTAELLAAKLELPKDKWTLCYQSQFGYDKWLKPSTQALLEELPKQGIKTLDIICPGFAVDCLETLEEIALRGTHAFQAAGGENLHYIKALNNNPLHIEALSAIIAAQ